MIALDTNILVHSHRRDSDWHERAYRVVLELAEGSSLWCVPWPCIHEFLAVVTNRRLFRPPTPLSRAIAQVETWMESPSLQTVGELKGHWKELRALLTAGRIVGGAVHDARIAAICRENGVRELWSADRDFARMTGITVRNPLVG